MLNTAVSILAAVALLMPGFIIAELGGGRSPRSSRSDLELALRALAFTIVVQLIFGFWTAHLVRTIGPSGEWVDHFWAISAYVAVVLLAVPIAVGVLVNVYVVRVEDQDGPPGRIATFLGAGEARDAFDYAYQRWRGEGGYVIVELIGHCPETPRLVGGVYGKRSAVGQTPQPHDIYLEALCTVEEDSSGIRTLAERVVPDQGVYIAADQVARVDLVSAGLDTLQA
jgi:hypothetical protein